MLEDMHDSGAVSRQQTLFNGDEDDEANSHYIVVELKDEDLKAPTEADLSIFAPVESSECEEDEDELSDSSGVSTWRRTNTRERGLTCASNTSVVCNVRCATLSEHKQNGV